MIGGSQSSWSFGGTGDDTFILGLYRAYVPNAPFIYDLVSEKVGEGTDRVLSYRNIDMISYANVEIGELAGTANLSITGHTANDIMIGNAGDNKITGGAGNDTIQLNAGTGRNLQIGKGEAGNDRYIVIADMGRAAIGFETAAQGTADVVEFRDKNLADFTITKVVSDKFNGDSVLLLKAGGLSLYIGAAKSVLQTRSSSLNSRMDLS